MPVLRRRLRLVRDGWVVTVILRIRQVTRVRIGEHLSIRCWCGRSVSGLVDLVERAHARHLTTHQQVAELVYSTERTA